MEKQIHCYGMIETGWHRGLSGPGTHVVQEWYETASRDAGRRAKALRKLGYTVLVSPQGSQVTPVGTVKMTLLTVPYADDRFPVITESRMS